jgi:hypothetical protein
MLKNILSENIKDKFNAVLANSPFGEKERPEAQQKFDI